MLRVVSREEREESRGESRRDGRGGQSGLQTGRGEGVVEGRLADVEEEREAGGERGCWHGEDG